VNFCLAGVPYVVHLVTFSIINFTCPSCVHDRSKSYDDKSCIF